MLKTNLSVWIGLTAATALAVAPAAAQTPPAPTTQTNGGLPFDNVAGGSLGNRRPGLFTQRALRGTLNITQTPEDRQDRPADNPRKLSVQILLSILDGFIEAVQQALTGLNLVNDLSALNNLLGPTNRTSIGPAGG